jgi:ketosteroid isomerase-like protein
MRRLSACGHAEVLDLPRDTERLMSQDNVEIVRRLVVGDLEEALKYADPGIVWNPLEEPPTQGHEAVRSYLERWGSEWDEYEAVPEECVDGGDRVVVTVLSRGRGRGSGIEVDARFHRVYTLRDGKVVRMDEFAQRSEALESAGLSE